tara:strand:+ start:2311 stop:4209 length:1899 start_codon:yes stop_codon:yes gene_type:complete
MAEKDGTSWSRRDPNPRAWRAKDYNSGIGSVSTGQSISDFFQPFRSGTANNLGSAKDLISSYGYNLLGDLGGNLAGGIAGAFGAPETAESLFDFGNSQKTTSQELFSSAKKKFANPNELDRFGNPVSQDVTPIQPDALQAAFLDNAVYSGTDGYDLVDVLSGLSEQNLDPNLGRPEYDIELKDSERLAGTVFSSKGEKGTKDPIEELLASADPTRTPNAPTSEGNMYGMVREDLRRDAVEKDRQSLIALDEAEKEDDRKKAKTASETAFLDAMKEYSLESNRPAPKDADIDFYKNEFARATGIDVSGKPDKKAALMAFGLALMQNKAGKGFDISKMLTSVGEAGEKAAPELARAKEIANTAQLAAGKYALDKLASGESAAAALAAERRKFSEQVFLKQMEFKNKQAEAAAKGVEIKNSFETDIIPGIKVRFGNVGGNTVFTNGTVAATTLGSAYTNFSNAVSTIGRIEEAVTSIADSGSPTLSLIGESITNVLIGAGLKDAKVSFGEEGVGDAGKAKALRDSLISEFKRLITQESGNGVSEGDLERVEIAFGEIDFLSNPKDALFRLKNMKLLFENKISFISPYLEDLQDPTSFATEQEYKKTQERLEKSMKKSGFTIVSKDGETIADVADK